MSRIVLASTDTQFEARIRTVFGNSLNGHLRRFGENLEGDTEEVVSELTHTSPDVVAFGDDVGLDTALRLARVLERDRPEVTVMLVTEPSTKLWEQAMKAGVEVVLPPDAGDDQVREEFERVLAAADRRREVIAGTSEGNPRSHRVITVTAAKGGAGKSVVATNLAMGLAMAAPGKVAVVDLDLQFGDVAGGLQLVPQHSIADAARTPGLDLTSLKVFLTPHPASFYALCAPDSPTEADTVSVETTQHVLELLSEEFRYVVVDTAGGIDEHTLVAFEAATDLVLVGNMDVASVRATRKEVEVLDQLDLLHQVRHFVLNRADSRVGLDPHDVEATVGLRIDVALPSSRGVPVSFNQGAPIVQSDPRSPVAKELMALVERFAELPAEHKTTTSILPWRK